MSSDKPLGEEDAKVLRVYYRADAYGAAFRGETQPEWLEGAPALSLASAEAAVRRAQEHERAMKLKPRPRRIVRVEESVLESLR